MYIDDIFELDNIFNYEKKIEYEMHTKVNNISYWNASSEYQNFMLKYIKLHNEKNIFDYTYTYDIPQYFIKKICDKITHRKHENNICIITPSSTISIVNLINFLKLNKYNKLCIITPSYFSVEQNCKIMDLPYKTIPILYYDNRYVLPKQEILQGDFDAVWITSPVYSTGISYDPIQIDTIREIIKKQILVIADETLAFPGQEICKTIPINKYFYSICSPHKSLFINSIKFSVLLCPKENSDLLEQWIDVLGGGLLHSNITALSHFISPNFEYCTQKSSIWYQRGLNAINNVLEMFPNAYCNTAEVGPYKTIYIRNESNVYPPIHNLIKEYYVSYIPNVYHGFNQHDGFSFRINMSIPANLLQDYLYRILSFYT